MADLDRGSRVSQTGTLVISQGTLYCTKPDLAQGIVESSMDNITSSQSHPRLSCTASHVPPTLYFPIRHLRVHRHDRLDQVIHHLGAGLLPYLLDFVELLLRVLVGLLLGGLVAR